MTRWRIYRRRLVLLLGIALVTLIMLRWFEHHQVYHPSRTLEATGAELGRPFEDVYFQADDGVRLNGWFFPCNPKPERSSLAVLVCHGNGGNISHRLDLAAALLTTGVNVFLFDYRGYGRSQGHPSEAGTYRDAEAAFAWLQQKGFVPKHILIFGESLGGGVAAELATRVEPGGLVLQSTFTCIPDIGADLFPWLPVHWLCQIQYNTLQKLPHIKAPVLVMHSRADTLIRFAHSQRNFAAANQPKLFCELAGDHNDPLTNRVQFIADFEKFLNLISNPAVETSKTG